MARAMVTLAALLHVPLRDAALMLAAEPGMSGETQATLLYMCSQPDYAIFGFSPRVLMLPVRR